MTRFSLLVLIVALVAMLATAPATAKITPNGVSQGELVELLNDLINATQRNRAVVVASATDGGGASVSLSRGTMAVLIGNNLVYKAPAVVDIGTGTPGNVVGSTSKYTAANYVVGINASGTASVTKGTNGTGTTAVLARAAAVLPTLASGVAPVGCVTVTVDPRAAGAMTWTAGTSLTTTSEIMAIVGGYDAGVAIPSLSPTQDSGL